MPPFQVLQRLDRSQEVSRGLLEPRRVERHRRQHGPTGDEDEDANPGTPGVFANQVTPTTNILPKILERTKKVLNWTC